jgi:hypothetical protein
MDPSSTNALDLETELRNKTASVTLRYRPFVRVTMLHATWHRNSRRRSEAAEISGVTVAHRQIAELTTLPPYRVVHQESDNPCVASTRDAHAFSSASVPRIYDRRGAERTAQLRGSWQLEATLAPPAMMLLRETIFQRHVPTSTCSPEWAGATQSSSSRIALLRRAEEPFRSTSYSRSSQRHSGRAVPATSRHAFKNIDQCTGSSRCDRTRQGCQSRTAVRCRSNAVKIRSPASLERLSLSADPGQPGAARILCAWKKL